MMNISAIIAALCITCGVASAAPAHHANTECFSSLHELRQVYKTEHAYWNHSCFYVKNEKKHEHENSRTAKAKTWQKFWPKTEWSDAERTPFSGANAVSLEGSASVEDMSVKWSTNKWRNIATAFLKL